MHVEVGARGSGVVGGPQAQAVAAPEYLERGRGGKLRGGAGTRHVEQILHTPELYFAGQRLDYLNHMIIILKRLLRGDLSH